MAVTRSGLLNIHGWLPFSNSKTRPFTFQFDPNAHFDRLVLTRLTVQTHTHMHTHIHAHSHTHTHTHTFTHTLTHTHSHTTHIHRSKWQYLGGPFDQDLSVNYHLFVLSPNNKLLATAGHWDNSLRVHSVEKNKLVARLTHHNGMWTID